ncbi:hypothetical protein SAMN05216579_1200 [Pseudomonas granadensis]|nr:hypothetical protein SAMN05216579_1200 [Pseudomonas granadensis]
MGSSLFCFGLGGLWADQALGVLGEYPLLRVWLMAVSPLRRVTFFKRQKGNPKRLLLRSALAGSGPFAPGSIRAQRLRFASLHLLPLCLAAPDGRCAPTPGSIPALSLPTSLVTQDQEHSSWRSLLSGEKRVVGFGLVAWLPLTPALSRGRGSRFRLASKLAYDSVFRVGVVLASTSVSPLSFWERARVRGF